MKCKLCDQMFYIKRGILELFKTSKEYICNKCYKKYPIALSYEVIQLEKYHVILLSIFDRSHRIDYNVFYKEYSKVFISNYKRRGYKTLFIDYLSLSYDEFETLDFISKLLDSNIIIVALNVKK